jgi:calcineurin-like phosphoesterase family protein
MNTALLHAWKSTVKNGDTIINLGDVSLKLGKEYLVTVLQRLPGHKILVMGNHDRKKPVRWWLDVGFNEVYPRPVVYEGKYILSQAVVDIFRESGFINIHGHIHNRESDISSCINVSIEKTRYKLVECGTVKVKLRNYEQEMKRIRRGRIFWVEGFPVLDGTIDNQGSSSETGLDTSENDIE